MANGKIITLTTDFGLSDPYVGILKGVMLSIAPDIQLVDLSHQVPPFSIRDAAYVIGSSWRWFPQGTVHLVVVDPGVGTDRAGLMVEADGHVFVAPDNGVLEEIFEQCANPRVFRIGDHCLRPGMVGHTFHGRDLFAPVAARLAAGMAMESVGEPGWHPARVPQAMGTTDGMDRPSASVGGAVVYCDHYGNLMTDVDGSGWTSTPAAVQIGPHRVPFVRTYESVPTGALLALLSSRGTVEVAARCASACVRLGMGVGSPVEVLW